MYYLIYVLIGVLLLVAIWFIVTKNKLNQTLVKIDEASSGIDVALTKRYDVLTKMMDSVKGYMKHEKDTLEDIVKARNSFEKAGDLEGEVKADNQLTKAVTKLFALAEAYPELKANENFVNLQAELSGTEDKVATARQFYSDTVLLYNNKIQMFPSNIVAKLFGLIEEKFFEATDEEKENVKVKF